MIGPGPSTREIRETGAPMPVTIIESRYGGHYSRGQWVIVAGTWRPMEITDAFASDVPCMAFWDEREEEGPEFTIDIERGDETVEYEMYAAAGDDPNELVREMYEHYVAAGVPE